MSWLSYSSLIPPNLFILLTILGVVIAWRWTRLGLVVATAGAAFLCLAAMPVVADCLLRSVEALAAATPTLPSEMPPGAIVVLSGDYRTSGTPGEPDTVGPLTLERLAEAAKEERRLGLPVLVSGGWPDDAHDSLAGLMSAALQEDFRVPVRWREERSANTYENAAFSAEILRRAGVPSALLVTHPWHMARALWSFRAVGYPVIPAGSHEGGPLPLTAGSFLPQVPALLGSYYALHELIGLGWYRWRYGDWRA
jgi:uncharacterized SAM-binding protein YcdF (DUF218 family)